MTGTVMKSITIHQIDDDINKKISQLAREKKMSLNKTIKYLLRKALNLESNAREVRKKELSKFLGVWNKSDLNSFKKATADFEKVSHEDWK
jgi:predicted transcriptional regulator